MSKLIFFTKGYMIMVIRTPSPILTRPGIILLLKTGPKKRMEEILVKTRKKLRTKKMGKLNISIIF
jgi:hypothetical protein